MNNLDNINDDHDDSEDGRLVRPYVGVAQYLIQLGRCTDFGCCVAGEWLTIDEAKAGCQALIDSKRFWFIRLEDWGAPCGSNRNRVIRDTPMIAEFGVPALNEWGYPRGLYPSFSKDRSGPEWNEFWVEYHERSVSKIGRMRNRVLNFLRSHPKGESTDTIVRGVGGHYKSTVRLLGQMVNDGELTRLKERRFRGKGQAFWVTAYRLKVKAKAKAGAKV